MAVPGAGVATGSTATACAIDFSGSADVGTNHFGSLAVDCDGTLDFTSTRASGDADCTYEGYAFFGDLTASQVG
jgi:hypothetical protein